MGKYYVAGIPFDSENSLKHYGVKGMEWDKHKFGLDADTRFIKWIDPNKVNVGSYGKYGKMAEAAAKQKYGAAVPHSPRPVTTYNKQQVMDHAKRMQQNMAQKKWNNSPIGKASNFVTGTANRAGKAIGTAANAVGNWAGQQAQNVGNTVGQAAKGVGKWAGQQAKNVSNTVGQAAQDVGKWAGQQAQNVANSAPVQAVGRFVDQNITGNTDRAAAQGYQQIAENLADNHHSQKWEDAAKRAQERADNTLFGRVGNAANAVGQAAQNVANSAPVQAVGEAARNVGNAVSGAAQGVGDWAGQQAQNVANSAPVQAIGEAARNVGNAVTGAANAVGDWAGQQAQNVGNTVGQAAEQVRGGIGGFFDRVGDAVGGAANAVGDWAGQAANNVGNAVSGAAQNVGNAVGNFFSNRDEYQRLDDLSKHYDPNTGKWDSEENRKAFYDAQDAYNRHPATAIPDMANEIGNNVKNFVDYNITGEGQRRMADMLMQNPDQVNEIYENDGTGWKKVSQHTNAEAAERELSDAKNNTLFGRVGNAANAVGQAAQNVGNAVSGAANKAVEGAKGFLNSAGQWVSGAANNVKNTASKAASDAKKGASGFLNSAGQWVSNATGNVKNTAQNVGNTVGQAAQNVGNTVGQAAEQARGGIGGFFNRVGDWGREAAGNVGNWAGQAAQNVGNAVSGAAQNVGEFTRDLPGNIAGAARGAGDWAGQAANNVGNFVDQNITGNSARAEANRYNTFAQNPNMDSVQQLMNQRAAENAQARADNTLFGRVGNAAGAVGDWARNVPGNIAGAARDVGDWAGQAARDVGGAVSGAARGVGDWASNAAGNMGNWAGQAAQNVGNAAKGVYQFLDDIRNAETNAKIQAATQRMADDYTQYLQDHPENPASPRHSEWQQQQNEQLMEQLRNDPAIRAYYEQYIKHSALDEKPDGVSDAFWEKFTADGGTREDYERDWR